MNNSCLTPAALLILLGLSIGVAPLSRGGAVKRPQRIGSLSSFPLPPTPLPSPGFSPSPLIRETPRRTAATPVPRPEAVEPSSSPPPLFPTTTPSPAAPAAPTPVPSPTPRVPLSCEADRVRYLESGKIVLGEGNVHLEYKDMKLDADKVTIYVARKEAIAEGNVKFTQGDNYINTDKMRYDFIKEEGFLTPGKGHFAPWYGNAEKVETEQKKEVFFEEGYATTCDLEEPHYRFQASKFIIYLDDKIVAKNVVFYVGNIPLMWFPYYQRSLKNQCQGFFLYPGFRTSWGFYFLSGYHWCAPGVNLTFHLDYRYRQGWAYGLDGLFYPGEGTKNRGDWQTYYLDDKKFDDPSSGETKKAERYLAQIWYRHYFPWDIRGDLAANYFSDSALRQDYFRKQYDANSQPQSYIYFSKKSDDYVLSLTCLPRLNKFYQVTEKLPEVKFQVKEISIGETNFYYEGATSYTNFYKLYADESSARYQSGRFDTVNQLSYSKKLFGWLNILPAAGFRETFYTRGPGKSDPSEPTPEPTPETTPEPTPEPDERKNFNRHIFFSSLGLSTDIYGIFSAENDRLDIHKLRHVITPSITYVFSTQPTELSDEIYQFDSIDDIDRANYTQLGLRNRLQTRRTSKGTESNWTLFDLILKTNVATDPDRDNAGRLFTDLDSELEITPFSWLSFDTRLIYDTYDNIIEKTSVEFDVKQGNDWNSSLFYSYRRESERNRLGASAFVRLNSKWAFKVYGRYDLVEEEFEEESLTIYRDLHCWDSYLLMRHREAEDDFEISIAFWIKAFPKSPLNLSN